MPAQLATPVTSWRWLVRLVLLLAMAGAYFGLPWLTRVFGREDGRTQTKTAYELTGSMFLDDIDFVAQGVALGAIVLILVLRGARRTTRRMTLVEFGFVAMLVSVIPGSTQTGLFGGVVTSFRGEAGLFLIYGAALAWGVLNAWDVFRAPWQGEDKRDAAGLTNTGIAATWALYGVVALSYTFYRQSGLFSAA